MAPPVLVAALGRESSLTDAASSTPMTSGSTSSIISALSALATNSTTTETSANNELLNEGDGKAIERYDDGDEPDEADEAVDSASSKRLSVEQQLEMMRGKLARRNKVLEVVRRAYYHDVIVVKEELRHARLQATSAFAPPLLGFVGSFQQSSLPLSSSRSTVSNAPSTVTTTRAATASHRQIVVDDRLSSIPSVDLRDVLPLFAPAETVLKLHPCEACGGHLELVHGESRELQLARQEMVRATKSEQQMKAVVHRLRTEVKEKEDLNEALQQRVKALVKENSYTLEQLQASRKMERDQKTVITNLRSKLQVAQTAQEDLDRVSAEFKDVKQQLVRSNHDRDIFSASNNHLKEELAEISKTLHQAKVDHVQLESDFGTTYYKLQEELKKAKQLRDELTSERASLHDKTKLSDELQQSLTALKDEFARTTMQTGQTKRQLEDQLADEETAREEAQEQNIEFRKINKKLLRELEQLQRDPLGFAGSATSSTSAGGESRPHQGDGKPTGPVVGGGGGGGGDGPVDMRAMIRKKIDDAQRQLEHALMREHDLLGQATRQKEPTGPAVAGATLVKPSMLRKKLSRMPSTTTITRLASPPEPAAAESQASTTETSDTGTNRPGSSGQESQRRSSGQESQRRSSALLAGGGEALQGDGFSGLDVKAFETYHQNLQQLMLEIDEGNERSEKQQKAITDLERKNLTLIGRLEEAKVSIETLSGSVTALKTRLNQDSAGAAEHLEDLRREVQDSKRDQQYENERGHLLLHFLRTISNYTYELCSQKSLVVEFDFERPNTESSDDADSLLSPELLQRKRELRKKVLMDRAMKKFSQQCHQRAEMVALELKKLADTVQRLRVDLDEAENKLDSDQLVIRNLEAENSKLQLTVEVARTNLSRSDKEAKQLRGELETALAQCTRQSEELKVFTADNIAMNADIARLTASLFEKTKVLEKEIHFNSKTSQKIAGLELSLEAVTTERDALVVKLQDIEDMVEWKHSTNKEVGIMVAPDVMEAEMQTDKWRPQGLILKQRNDPQRMPQRYLGHASVTIACGPEFLDVDKSALPTLSGSSNQSPRPSSRRALPEPLWADPTEQAREMLEFDLFPPAKAGVRQIKTSQATTRPRNLSRLFLSSDGVSQKYIAPSREPTARPSTTL